MNCSKSFSLSLLFFSLFLHATFGASPLFHKCFSKQNYTANSPFGDNLNELFNLLSKKAPPTGFGTGTIGQSENRINGLALCRGDVSVTNCSACIVDAAKKLNQRCPYNKGAIVWYDFCLVKYSDVEFFRKIDNDNKFAMLNVEDVESDPERFNKEVEELLTSLADKAYTSPKLYVTGEVELEKSEKLYGLVQCTRDLSRVDCKKCLVDAISGLPNCCDGKKGGRVVGGSCYVRYELYPIVDGQ